MSPDQFEQLAAPLREEAARLHEQLATIDKERDGVLAQIRRIDGALGRLFPEPPSPKKGRPTKHLPPGEPSVTAIREFIEQRNGDLTEGFTASELHRLILINGAPLVGKESTRRSIIELHEQGILRLDRRGRGGSKVYKLIAP